MKKIWILLGCILLIAFTAATGFTVDEELNKKVEQFYHSMEQATLAKDVDACFSYYSSDYKGLLFGPKKEDFIEIIKKLFSENDGIRLNCKIERIEPFENFIQVIQEETVEVKKTSDSEWTLLNKQMCADFLKEENGELKLLVNTPVNKDRFQYIQGKRFSNETIGISFSVPNDFIIIPAVHPTLSGSLAFLSSDASFTGMFAYVELPYNVGAKEAVLADDAAVKRIAGDSHQSIRTGPVPVGNLEAFECVSQFQFSNEAEARKRRNVYFTAGGLLYVFIFDAVPASKWEQLEPKFQSILDSFVLSEDAQKDGANKVREAKATGEVADRIYNNDELGCQIAAPEGWTLKTTALGEAFLFTVNMNPPKGGSVARFLGVEMKIDAPLEEILEKEGKGIEKLAKDFKIGPIESITVGDQEGKTCIQEFTLDGLGSMKRKSVMFKIDDVLYMILCDAVPASEYPQLESQFNEIIESFTAN